MEEMCKYIGIGIFVCFIGIRNVSSVDNLELLIFKNVLATADKVHVSMLERRFLLYFSDMTNIITWSFLRSKIVPTTHEVCLSMLEIVILFYFMDVTSMGNWGIMILYKVLIVDKLHLGMLEKQYLFVLQLYDLHNHFGLFNF